MRDNKSGGFHLKRKKYLTLSDFDDCLVSREQKYMDRKISSIIEKINPALISGFNLLRDIIGIENAYQLNREIIEYAENDEELSILTARPFYGKVPENTSKIIEELGGEAENIYFYPGKELKGEKIINHKSSIRDYFLGNGINEYKKEMIKKLKEDYLLSYFDDCEEILYDAKKLGVKTFHVDGGKVEEY